MENIHFDGAALEAIFLTAEISLFDPQNITEALYSEFQVETYDALNTAFLMGLAGNAVVYCLWCGPDKGNMQAVYIGHAAGGISRQRLRAHLTKKNAATGAQLDRVKEALGKGCCIGVSMVAVKPVYMRKALEEWLIAKNSNILMWNKTGKVLKSPLVDKR